MSRKNVKTSVDTSEVKPSSTQPKVILALEKMLSWLVESRRHDSVGEDSSLIQLKDWRNR